MTRWRLIVYLTSLGFKGYSCCKDMNQYLHGCGHRARPLPHRSLLVYWDFNWLSMVEGSDPTDVYD